MREAVVAHFTDGRLVKGYSEDFFPHKTTVHIAKDGSDGVQEIEIAGLKALFFVKSLTGDREYVDDQEAERAGFGRRIKVHFKDGETIVGYTSGYSADRDAFFVFPADPKGNNTRVYVVTAATDEIEFI
jgi:hypothetical protein